MIDKTERRTIVVDEIMNIAAYCRVSTDKEDQINSLEAQKDFFTEYTQRTGNNLVRLYADEGISGTKIKNRRAFLRKRNRSNYQQPYIRLYANGTVVMGDRMRIAKAYLLLFPTAYTKPYIANDPQESIYFCKND